MSTLYLNIVLKRAIDAITLPPIKSKVTMSMQPLAKYRLGKVLGRGGMAIVYEAMLHEGGAPGSIGQRCVVKRILPEVARDSSFVKMFLAEARLSVLLRHPNIVRVFEFGAMQ